MNITTEATSYALDILREFVEDVRAAGVADIEEEWPDLYITFCRATKLLRESGNLQATEMALGTCRECGEPMVINSVGVSNHVLDYDDGVIDYDADADHVAILDLE